VGSLKNVNPKKDLRPPFFGSFFGRAKNEQIIFGRTKKEQENIWASKNRGTMQCMVTSLAKPNEQ
jgi:hypothetical protein